MSTILDSLKKSSDQRDNSKANPIDNFNFKNTKKSTSSFSKVIIVFFVVLFFVACYWVYQNYFSTDISATTNTDISSQQKIDPSQNINTTQIANKKEKPDSEIIKAQIKMLKEHKKAEEEKKQNNLTELNTTNAPIVETKEEVKPPTSLTNTDDGEVKQVQTQANPIVSEEPIEQNQAEQKPTLKRQYRLLYELPFSVRKEIPELKLNIHVFDKLPENRMVIINGVRFDINDMIEEQILLKDILENGILLDFNGTEFFIKN